VNLGGMPAWKVRGGGTGNIVGYGSATKSKENFNQKLFGTDSIRLFELINLCEHFKRFGFWNDFKGRFDWIMICNLAD
jgi:hypothetical protein